MADLTRSRCYCQILQVQNERTTKVLQVWRHGYENENLLVMDVFPVLYIWAEAIKRICRKRRSVAIQKGLQQCQVGT